MASKRSTSEIVNQALQNIGQSDEAVAAKLARLESEINEWESLGTDIASMLEELAGARVSVTMTEHRAADLMREQNAMLAQLAARIREQLG